MENKIEKIICTNCQKETEILVDTTSKLCPECKEDNFKFLISTSNISV